MKDARVLCVFAEITKKCRNGNNGYAGEYDELHDLSRGKMVLIMTKYNADCLSGDDEGMMKLHVLHLMGYKLKMMKDVQIIRPYSMMRAFNTMDDLPLCTYLTKISSGIMAADLLHDLRCNKANTPTLGTQGDNVALVYVLKATQRLPLG
eukprot:gene20533-40336_t